MITRIRYEVEVEHRDDGELLDFNRAAHSALFTKQVRSVSSFRTVDGFLFEPLMFDDYPTPAVKAQEK